MFRHSCPTPADRTRRATDGVALVRHASELSPSELEASVVGKRLFEGIADPPGEVAAISVVVRDAGTTPARMVWMLDSGLRG
jgi:hypothetical protein